MSCKAGEQSRPAIVQPPRQLADFNGLIMLTKASGYAGVWTVFKPHFLSSMHSKTRWKEHNLPCGKLKPLLANLQTDPQMTRIKPACQLFVQQQMPLILSLTETVSVSLANQGMSHQSIGTFGDCHHHVIHKPCLTITVLVNFVQHTAGMNLQAMCPW